MSLFIKRLIFFIPILFLFFLIDFPPAQKIIALNRSNNWDFNGNANGWTAANGSGSNICGDTGTLTETTFTTFAYSAAVGASAFAATGGTVSGADLRGKITQTITAPGSGTVKLKGRFNYYANSSKGFQTSWIRLDLFNSSDSTFIAGIGCTSFAASVAWTSLPWSSEIGVSGGTTYTVRATLKIKNKASAAAAVTLGIDNIELAFAPVGVAISSPDNTPNLFLSWNTSVGGSNAPGLNLANPYKIYRDTSSPVSTFLSNGTTNTFTDSSTTGNTTYFYAISDVDTNNTESALSNEVSLKTFPGAPSTPSFSNPSFDSLTVGWTAPSGGADSYKLERCSGTGCSNFSQIAASLIGTTYLDVGLTGLTAYRYRLRATNNRGDGVYSNIGETSTPGIISISLTSDGFIPFGYLGLGASQDTTASGINNPETVLVDSGPVNLDIKSTAFSDGSNTWSLSGAPGADQVFWEYSKDGSSWGTFTAPDTSYTFDTNVAQGQTRNLFLRLTMPISTAFYTQHSASVTIMAVQP